MTDTPTNDGNRLLFAGLSVLALHETDACEPARRAVALVGRLVAELGAEVTAADEASAGGDPVAWAGGDPTRVVLVAATPDGASAAWPGNVVRVVAEPWHDEATLFAASGIADLFGEPDGPPLVPDGHWAAGTIAHATIAALAAAQALAVRGDHDHIEVDALDALRWVNWKAVALAEEGEPITREGADAGWPALKCRDGYLAFVFTPRDWPAIVEMVDDDRLREEWFSRGRSRREHHAEFLQVLREWAAGLTRAEADALFLAHAVPGSSVATAADLPDDPTMQHRRAFRTVDVDGTDVHVAVAPVRTRATAPDAATAATPAPSVDAGPLAGFRVLDLGVLTAGAGTSSLLADLGAEVIKIESAVKPDMFRFWGGNPESPLFDFSNRSKLGVDLNLKDEHDRQQFLALVAGADAVIENFRRGVLERLGLAFADLVAVNPHIVLGSISGQGLTGPRALHTTFGSTLEAAAWMSAAVAGPDGLPYVSGANLNYPDQTVCSFAAGVMTAAMTQSRRSGRGFHLDVSQLEVAVVAGGSLVESADLGVDAPTWHLHRSDDGGWHAVGADSVTRVASLSGVDLLAACDGPDSRAVVRDDAGALFKGFPFDLRQRPLSITGPAPAIGQHNAVVLQAGDTSTSSDVGGTT